MNKMILATILVLSSNAFAQDPVMKECLVTMKQLDSGEPVDMNVKVQTKSDGSLYAVVTQTAGGVTGSYDDVVEIREESVRTNLTSQSDMDDMNFAEDLIVHAMILAEDPVFQGAFSAGFDLKNVRSAKLFTIGQKTNMGSSTIVEARDANNQLLGSFLGGFLVSPCK